VVYNDSTASTKFVVCSESTELKHPKLPTENISDIAAKLVNSTSVAHGPHSKCLGDPVETMDGDLTNPILVFTSHHLPKSSILTFKAVDSGRTTIG
jgi:hypothetical protein